MLCLLAREAIEALTGLGELGIFVPPLPVLLGTPGPHDDAGFVLTLGPEQLSSDPACLLPRRGEPLAHHGVPLLLSAFLESNGGHDGHHGRSSPVEHPHISIGPRVRARQVPWERAAALL